ncbi:MAG: alpha/beta fold hydrolase [Hassallia sp.]
MSIFCLVHGACQGAWCWNLLIPELEAQGHKAVTMDLPIEDASASLSDFADAVLRSLPKDEDDIILVGHSMAGAVIPIVACKRPVRKLVFFTALIPYPGTSTADQFYEDIPDIMKAAGCDRPEERGQIPFPPLFHGSPIRVNAAQSRGREYCFIVVSMAFLNATA